VTEGSGAGRGYECVTMCEGRGGGYTRVVDDGAAEEHGDPELLVLEEALQGVDGGLGIQRVEDGLNLE